MADALPPVEGPFPLADTPAGILTAIGPSRHRSLAWFLAAGGHVNDALELAQSYRSPLPDQGTGPLALANTGHAEFGRGMALASLGDPEGAHRAFANARDIYRQLDHHAVLAFVDITEMIDVMIPYRTNDLAGRHRLAHDAAMAIARAHGAIPTEVMPNRAHLVNMYLDGKWHEARRIAAECRVHGTYAL